MMRSVLTRERQDERAGAPDEEDHCHVEQKGDVAVDKERDGSDSFKHEVKWFPTFKQGDEQPIQGGADLVDGPD